MIVVSIPLMAHNDIWADSVANFTLNSSNAAFSLNLIDSTTTLRFVLAENESFINMREHVDVKNATIKVNNRKDSYRLMARR